MNEDGNNRVGQADEVDLAAIQKAILQYMERHPESCDTALGVARWWLPHQGIVAGEALVRAALEDLVERGRLGAVALPGGETQYVSARRAPVRS